MGSIRLRAILLRLSSTHLRESLVSLRFAPVLFLFLALGSWTVGQTPAQPPSQTKPQQSPPAAIPVSAKANTDSDKTKADKNSAAAADKVYTDEDVESLPPGGISVIGPAPSPANAAAVNRQAAAKRADKKAQAAYWKAHYTAARDKLAQDQKALPELQSELEAERVQQWSVDECSGQVNSDLFMDLLRRIDETKQAIENDKQALSDLDDEFRKAGGLPGWIR
jgi:cytoskeletal protein RodZ